MYPQRRKRSLLIISMIGIVAVIIATGIAIRLKITLWPSGLRYTEIPVQTPIIQPEISPLTNEGILPIPEVLAARLASVVNNPQLGRFTGQISDAFTGAILWEQHDSVPMQPASTNKLLTATAALLTLDPHKQITTRIFLGSDPQTVVLVGAGDPTLSGASPDQPTWYRDAPRISDLATQVLQANIHPVRIQIDTSTFQGPTMAPGWDNNDIDGGDIAPIESAMVDAGRIQPATVESKRSRTPALDAGLVLADALGVDHQQVFVTGAVPKGKQLALVQSAPLMTRLIEMMNHSDNVMAECIGREVAQALDQPQSFTGSVNAILSQLDRVHVPLAGIQLYDSSGLSIDDRLTSAALDAVMRSATNDNYPVLRSLLDVLPVAGGSGTLSNRFTNPDINSDAPGWLRAKTGSLTGTNALVGVVTDQDWRVLTFAFISNEAGPEGRNALDAVASTLRSCGCSVS